MILHVLLIHLFELGPIKPLYHHHPYVYRPILVYYLCKPGEEVGVACEDDDSGLPEGESTFNRHLKTESISESEELRHRRDRDNFNFIKTHNITITIIEPMSIVVGDKSPITNFDFWLCLLALV